MTETTSTPPLADVPATQQEQAIPFSPPADAPGAAACVTAEPVSQKSSRAGGCRRYRGSSPPPSS